MNLFLFSHLFIILAFGVKHLLLSNRRLVVDTYLFLHRLKCRYVNKQVDKSHIPDSLSKSIKLENLEIKKETKKKNKMKGLKQWGKFAFKLLIPFSRKEEEACRKNLYYILRMMVMTALKEKLECC